MFAYIFFFSELTEFEFIKMYDKQDIENFYHLSQDFSIRLIKKEAEGWHLHLNTRLNLASP